MRIDFNNRNYQNFSVNKADNAAKQANQDQNYSQRNMSLPDVSFKYNFFDKSNSVKNTPNSIAFMGHTVHIVDGFNHATNMKHFLSSSTTEADIVMHEVEVNEHDENMKQLKSLEEQLQYLNAAKDNYEGEYVSVLGLATVPLLNLKDQYHKVMGEEEEFTPENVKSKKDKICGFLKKIYDEPDKYRDYIGYMDSRKQGIEYSYGVIREINKLVDKKAKVYMPSGHPSDQNIKWQSKEYDFNPELYHYISTGEDLGGHVQEALDRAKTNNWYDFNLLTLSNANIVGVKAFDGQKDYIYAAYDSCVTDGQRGVYNFSPVRENGVIKGYSYHDTKTVEYPYDEFPANDKIAKLLNFVGRHKDEVLANEEETKEFLELKAKGKNSDAKNKLYKLEDVFSKKEIEDKRHNLLGKYVNKDLDLIFDSNNADEITFVKLDCEGTGKPSVLPMWGSCFATMNAVARDIAIEDKYSDDLSEEDHRAKLQKQIFDGRSYIAREKKYPKTAEQKFFNAISYDKSYKIKHPDYIMDYRPYLELGNMAMNDEKYDSASAYFNNGINLLSQKVQGDKTNIKNVFNDYNNYKKALSDNEKYDKDLEAYNKKFFLVRLFTSKPQKPLFYTNPFIFKEGHDYYKTNILPISNMFDNLSEICKIKNEEESSNVCTLASNDVKNCTQRGEKILQMRSQGVQYLKDLY